MREDILGTLDSPGLAELEGLRDILGLVVNPDTAVTLDFRVPGRAGIQGSVDDQDSLGTAVIQDSLDAPGLAGFADAAGSVDTVAIQLNSPDIRDTVDYLVTRGFAVFRGIRGTAVRLDQQGQ